MLILKYGQYFSKKALVERLLPVTSRSYCDFAHRWMPGPYPKTKEERDAAAAKYNMIPEDYVPTAEDRGLGDYPDIESLSHYPLGRPYYLDYDEPFMRRNYGEPISEHLSTCLVEPPVFHVDKKTSRALGIFWVCYISFLIIAIFGPENAILKAKPKQYPSEYFIGVKPKVHYEFESTKVEGGHH